MSEFPDIDVRALRERLGWSQERLAIELGLDRSTVSRMESGQPPSGPTAILLRRLGQDLYSKRDGSEPSVGLTTESTGERS
jgi:transcriptional regulator with XRE-family HTH domain